jgi:Tfp pilus assembly protein PilE
METKRGIKDLTKTELCIVIVVLIVLAMIFIPNYNAYKKHTSEGSSSDVDFTQKYNFIKRLDAVCYQSGTFYKVEMHTSKRVDITLDMQNNMSKLMATSKSMTDELRKNGFETLRIKDKFSDRYEDYSLSKK